MGRQEDAMLYTIGTLHRLMKKGFISGAMFDLTSKGLEEFKKLKESGFRPNKAELEKCMLSLQNYGRGK